ncbi:MAG: hypothetical protein EA402_04125 [Planctomycetota bacterium]|nr:MAG: hypothetical protein EA402_04125 [Planctomycetota bacterium]
MSRHSSSLWRHPLILVVLVVVIYACRPVTQSDIMGVWTMEGGHEGMHKIGLAFKDNHLAELFFIKEAEEDIVYATPATYSWGVDPHSLLVIVLAKGDDEIYQAWKYSAAIHRLNRKSLIISFNGGDRFRMGRDKDAERLLTMGKSRMPLNAREHWLVANE